MERTIFNKKKKSQEKIEKIFLELIETHEINEITVTDICKKASINRTTFYANYLDIYDLVEKIKESMFQNMLNLYQEEVQQRKHSYNYLKLFKHIKNNQNYYKILLKLKIDFSKYYNNELELEEALKYLGSTKNIDYHVEFFKAGINAIITKWLKNGCKETPEEINEILKTEYQKRN